MFTMEPAATSYLSSLPIWRPPWYELPEEDCSNDSCISVYNSVLSGNLSKLDNSVSGERVISSQSAASKHTSPGQVHLLTVESMIQLNFQVCQPPWPNWSSNTKRSSSLTLPRGFISLFSMLWSATLCLLDPVEPPWLPDLSNPATSRPCMSDLSYMPGTASVSCSGLSSHGWGFHSGPGPATPC
jgi:hypothetical protein